jgi:hypothetical protein
MQRGDNATLQPTFFPNFAKSRFFRSFPWLNHAFWQRPDGTIERHRQRDVDCRPDTAVNNTACGNLKNRSGHKQNNALPNDQVTTT